MICYVSRPDPCFWDPCFLAKLQACLADMQLADTGWRMVMALVRRRKALG